MARVIENIHITKNYYLLRTDERKETLPGQFYMLRAWDNYPTLSRPISIYDVDEKRGGLDFLYEVRGIGTKQIANLKPGDPIKIYGPYGNSFPTDVEELAMVGGGVGTAPFYYLSKKIKEKNPHAKLTFYIGEQEDLELERAFQDLDVDLKVKKGGLITDIIDFEKHENIYACGPNIMMKVVTEMALESGRDTFVSLDKRMGCGVGACLSCTCDTINGRKRACKEGPVFKGSEIFGE